MVGNPYYGAMGEVCDKYDGSKALDYTLAT